MRRVLMGTTAILVLALALAAPGAGAETQWVGSEELTIDPGNPAVLSFVVDIHEPGNYQVRLLARGESKRQLELQLSLRPEAGGEERTVRFSFTGAGCG